jgi:hypothetical protein
MAPTSLRQRVLGDLRRVKPLNEPWKRALVLLPLGLALVALVPWRLGVRHDVHALASFYVWGLSLLQVSTGVAIVAAVFREVIPGRQMPRTGPSLLFGAGLALAIAVTYATWYASGTVTPELLRVPFWKICFRMTLGLSVPGTFVILVLAARGVIWRPALVGGLAGLASGLMSDAGWRTFCDVSQPSHVLSAHFAAIVAASVIGAGMATLWVRVSSTR